VAEVTLGLVLGRGVLRIVHQHVDTVAELEHRLGDEVVGIIGGASGTMVGDVRDRHTLEVDPVSERRVGVPNPARSDLGAVDREVVVAHVFERDVAAQVGRGDREVGRTHHTGERLRERAVGLARPEDPDLGVGAERRREERQPHDVIPVQVRQQHRGEVGRRHGIRFELGAVVLGDDVAVLAQPGAEVEHHRLVARRLEGNTRRVAAVALVSACVAGSRAPHAVEGQPHPRHGREG
jgi:hypothetical protein